MPPIAILSCPNARKRNADGSGRASGRATRGLAAFHNSLSCPTHRFKDQIRKNYCAKWRRTSAMRAVDA